MTANCPRHAYCTEEGSIGGIKVGKIAEYTIPSLCILNITLCVMKIDVYESVYAYLFWVKLYYNLCLAWAYLLTTYLCQL